MLEQQMQPFDYRRPAAWAEAMDLLAQPGAVAKMGGCDVLTRYRSGHLKADLLVGLNDLPGMKALTHDAGGLHVGAAVTLAEFAAAPDVARGWPVLAQIASEIASPAIRLTASVVGNVAQGWSVSDLVPLFQVYGATLTIRGRAGEREMPVTDYARSRGNGALQAGEIIAALKLPQPAPGFRVAYERFSVRAKFDLPLVAVAIGARVDGERLSDVRIATVGGAPMPARCEEAEALLAEGAGEKAAAALAAWARPADDYRASAAYRRHLLGVMFRRALATLAAGPAGK